MDNLDASQLFRKQSVIPPGGCHCPYAWDSDEDQGMYSAELGGVSIRKTVLPGMAIPMLKIRRPNGRLIFNMEIAIRR